MTKLAVVQLYHGLFQYLPQWVQSTEKIIATETDVQKYTIYDEVITLCEWTTQSQTKPYYNHKITKCLTYGQPRAKPHYNHKLTKCLRSVSRRKTIPV